MLEILSFFILTDGRPLGSEMSPAASCLRSCPSRTRLITQTQIMQALGASVHAVQGIAGAIARGFYAVHLARWLTLFRSRQLLVLTSDVSARVTPLILQDLFFDTHSTSRVFGFLQVPDIELPYYRNARGGLSVTGTVSKADMGGYEGMLPATRARLVELFHTANTRLKHKVSDQVLRLWNKP